MRILKVEILTNNIVRFLVEINSFIIQSVARTKIEFFPKINREASIIESSSHFYKGLKHFLSDKQLFMLRKELNRILQEI